MSKDYPLSMERFLALLESLEPVSEQLATLRRFLSNTLPEGFPVKLGKLCGAVQPYNQQGLQHGAVEALEGSRRRLAQASAVVPLSLFSLFCVDLLLSHSA